MGLVASKGKMKMLSTNRDVRCIVPQASVVDYSFDIVTEIIYLGSVFTTKNDN